MKNTGEKTVSNSIIFFIMVDFSVLFKFKYKDIKMILRFMLLNETANNKFVTYESSSSWSWNRGPFCSL